jgi:hypothetical protein
VKLNTHVHVPFVVSTVRRMDHEGWRLKIKIFSHAPLLLHGSSSIETIDEKTFETQVVLSCNGVSGSNHAIPPDSGLLRQKPYAVKESSLVCPFPMIFAKV